MTLIKVNTPFIVTVCGRSYNALCLNDSNGKSYEKNVIKNTDNGEIWTVEDLWFDQEFTGRRIRYFA